MPRKSSPWFELVKSAPSTLESHLHFQFGESEKPSDLFAYWLWRFSQVHETLVFYMMLAWVIVFRWMLRRRRRDMGVLQDLTMGYLFLVAKKKTSLDERSRNKTRRYTWGFILIHTWETSEFCNILASEPLTSFGGSLFNSKMLHQTSWNGSLLLFCSDLYQGDFDARIKVHACSEEQMTLVGEYNNSIRNYSLCTCEEQMTLLYFL